MQIALAQIDCVTESPGLNRDRFGEYALQARDADCRIVIFPELSDTGYEKSAILNHADCWPGKAFAAAQSAAAKNGLYLVAGLSERDGERIFNSLAVFNPCGELVAKYRKTHLFPLAPVFEGKVFTPGEKAVVVEVEGTTWGLTICYDLRFPEIFRALTMKGAEVLLNCSAWPAIRPSHWDYLSRARAIENQAFFVGVNRVGSDDGTKMNGASRVVTPMGELLCEGSNENEALLTAEVDLNLLKDFRSKMPVLQDRRPEVFGDFEPSI